MTRKPTKENQFRSSIKRLKNSIHTSRALCALLFLCAALILSVIFLCIVMPKRYSLNVGDISHVSIAATKDVVDTISTEALQEEAMSRVEPTYLYKDSVAADVNTALSVVLGEAKNVQQYGQSILNEYAPGDDERQAIYSFTQSELKTARGMFSALSMNDYQLNTLLRTSDEDMASLNKNMSSAVRNTMNTTIRAGYVSDAVQSLQQVIGTKVNVDLLQNVVTPILRFVVQPNMVIDEEATEKLRQEAKNTVEPVIYKQGQYIVEAREIVTENQLQMLRNLGLLDNESIDITIYIGAFLTVVIALLVLWVFLLLLSRDILHQPKRLMILLIVLCLTTIFCALVSLVNEYLYPSLFCAMLICCLLGYTEAMAVVPCICLLINGLLMGNSSTVSGIINVNIIITTLVSSAVAITILKKKPYRVQIILSGLISALVNFVLVLTTGFLTNNALKEVLKNASMCAGGAVISSVLCVAVEPLADALFALATPSKLLELCNPNHPLLRRLMIEAPGTYHHSIIVANLAESAAEAIGANPLLARAGGYFHDIGKLKRPMYFKENQMGDNPHSRTNPYVSAAIVIAHTRDGLELAQQNRLPKEIQDIITEHHGNTPVMYFYNQALKSSDDQLVDITDFRYDGARPSTRESAIIMMADTVEAAVRSMPDPTPEKIKAFIYKLVQGKLTDGQLDGAPITLKNISDCCEVFATSLNGVFHERIEYPDITPSSINRITEEKKNDIEPVTAEQTNESS